jgi:MFS family permease
MTAAELRRQRLLSTGYFALAGITMALWGARLPALQARLHLHTATLSLGLLGAAAGMTLGLNLGGRLGDRFGAHRLQRPAGLALALALADLGLSTSTAWFIAACALFGLCHGLLDVSMNTTATQCQAGYGRPVLQGIHATYSLGALAGSLAAAATAALPVTDTYCAAALVLTAVLALLPPMPAAPPPAALPPGHRATRDRPPTALLALGALTACSLLGEGAAADWSAIQMRTLAHAAPATAALAYGSYSAAMAATRLAADRLTHRLGTQRLVRYGAATATAGLLATLLLPTAGMGLTGWALFGAGLAAVVPAAIAAAARLRPGRAGRDIALVTSTGYLGMVLGPAAIGALATITTLTLALTVPAASALAIAAAARAVHPTPQESQ